MLHTHMGSYTQQTCFSFLSLKHYCTPISSSSLVPLSLCTRHHSVTYMPASALSNIYSVVAIICRASHNHRLVSYTIVPTCQYHLNEAEKNPFQTYSLKKVVVNSVAVPSTLPTEAGEPHLVHIFIWPHQEKFS